MLRNIIITIYVVIIVIAITVLTLSNNITETGVIELGNHVLVEVESNILEPKTVKGDLVIADKTEKNVKEKDIISYITLENGATVLRTNQIAAVTKDSLGKKIYSLKREDGTIENIDDSCILGTYKMTVPFAGTILNYLLSPKGFYTIVLIPAIALAIFFFTDFLLDLKKSRK